MTQWDESFTDMEHGIFYRARGPNRSVRGLFTNFTQAEKKQLEDKGIKALPDGTAKCEHIEGKKEGICRKCLNWLVNKK